MTVGDNYQDVPAKPRAEPSCCAGVREASGCEVARPAIAAAPAFSFAPASAETQAEIRATMTSIPGGFFDMGARKARYPADFEGPVRRIRVSPFMIAPYAVTNRNYARFVAATGYKTVAETEGWSFVFHLLLDEPRRYPNSPIETPWWRQVHGATWFAPQGPGSTIEGREDHPAVHVSWFDAAAYCAWAGVRLLREAEWEKAARGGLAHKQFPWGNTLTPDGAHRCNIWQGDFPVRNSVEDGYLGTAPVNAFEPNGFGLYNMTGNVWEWCADWFGPPPPPTRLPPRDPAGPETGESRVIRGGSYLCHASYCERYKVHSRSRNTPDSSSGNTGFRIAADIEATG